MRRLFFTALVRQLGVLWPILSGILVAMVGSGLAIWRIEDWRLDEALCDLLACPVIGGPGVGAETLHHRTEPVDETLHAVRGVGAGHLGLPQGRIVGPGSRIPAIIISPFARKGFVDHTPYDTTSILRFIMERFELPTLHGIMVRDRAVAANGQPPLGDLSGALDFGNP